MKLKLSLIMSGVLAISGCGGSGENNVPNTVALDTTTSYPNPAPTISDSSAYNNAAIHDPSILKAVVTEGEESKSYYYVFGSHLAAARSEDLMNWTVVSSLGANHLVDESPLFNHNYSGEAAEGIAWSANFTGSWAAEVIQSKADGKYYFYYNHCAQDNPTTVEVDEVCWHRSYMGLAVADHPEGPYVNQGIFLRSGHTDEELAGDYPVVDPATGENITSYNPAHFPNAIDPAVFYDKDDNLWMTYGSYSGGIYLLDLDEATGMPVAGQGFGKRIAGSEGTFSSIEGSYIIYSPESDYYYLFVSFGGFDYRQGYNIRVARSRTPEGPYLDAAGNDMAATWNADAGVWEGGARVIVSVDDQGNPTSVDSNDYGSKLLGGFLFKSQLGDTSAEWGYLAPGHNSALYDEETGKHLLVTHTRFPDTGNGHAVRVHEMWVNNDGWLVASPLRYAPIDGENQIDSSDVIGDYRLVVQGAETNTSANESIYVKFTDRGRQITGDITGSYKVFIDQPERIAITLDGSYYEGVAKWQWDTAEERMTVAFSATNSDNESIFGIKMQEKSSAEVAADIEAALALPARIKDRLSLPNHATRSAQIAWTTSNSGLVTNTGRVIRPSVGDGDQNVTLTANVTLNGETTTYTYPIDLTVAERAELNRTAHFAFEDDLTDDTMTFDAAMPIGDRPYNTGEVTYSVGIDGQAVSVNGSNGVRLPDGLIDNYNYTVSFWMNPTVVSQWTAGFFGAVDEYETETGSFFADRWVSFLPMSWDGNTMLWSHNLHNGVDSWFDASTGLRIPENEWTHMAFSVQEGFVRVMINGEERFAGGNLANLYFGKNGVFTLGVNYWDVSFNGLIDEFKVYDEAMNAAQVKALDIDKLNDTELFQIIQDTLTLSGDLTAIIDDIELPFAGAFGSAVTWVSTDNSVIDPTSGQVNRPVRGLPDAPVTLTATITFGDMTATKEFDIIVKSNTPPQPIARFSFEDDLSDSTGNFDAGVAADKGIVVPASSENTYTTGVSGQAIEFLGDAGPGAKLPDNLITDHSYSISVWLNPTVKTQYTPALFAYVAADNWISLAPFGPGGGNTLLWAGSLAWYDGVIGSQIPSGQWSHIVFVINSGNFSAYLNGELVSELTNYPDTFTGNGVSQMALATNFWDVNYNGLMDELVIFDDPISQEDVSELFAEGAAE